MTGEKKRKAAWWYGYMYADAHVYSSLRLDAEYYIRKQIIPPLSRVFNLMGVGEFGCQNSMLMY